MSIIFRVIGGVGKFVAKHSKEFIVGGAVAGTGALVAGLHQANKAKKIDAEAVAIQQEALEKYKKSDELLQQVLADLGEEKKRTVASFDSFADTIERIQNRPQIKIPLLSRVKLPKYEVQEFKQLSANMGIVLGASVGSGVGALVGLAAFGASAVIASPAMVAGGVVVCVKGFGLKKKAIEKKKDALKMRENVEEILVFHSRLNQTANSFRECIVAVYEKYSSLLNEINVITTKKTEWQKFTRAEKRAVENTILLAKLLRQMCETELVIQQEKQVEEIEEVNELEVQKLQNTAWRTLAQCA